MDSSSSATALSKNGQEGQKVLLANCIVDMALDGPDWNGNGMAQYQEWTKSGMRSPASRRCLQDVKVSCNHNIMLGELVSGTRKVKFAETGGLV
jgi:hypothetical protein